MINYLINSQSMSFLPNVYKALRSLTVEKRYKDWVGLAFWLPINLAGGATDGNGRRSASRTSLN